MQTTITWLDPNVETPPFGKQFLALLSCVSAYRRRSYRFTCRRIGIGSHDGLRTWTKFAIVRSVVMTKNSPNDDESGDEFRDFCVDERGPACFDDYQFCLVDVVDNLFGDQEEELSWYSDAIDRWAPMPDFGELLNTKA